jgi:stage IV sporulation protein B
MIFSHCTPRENQVQENSSIFFDFFSGYETAADGILRGQGKRRGKTVKKIAKITVIFILCLNLLAMQAFGLELVVGGQVIGLELADNTVTVAGFDGEENNAAKAAGLQVGDRIEKIDGKPVHCAEDIRQALHCSKGCVELRVRRQGKEHALRAVPAITADGPKLGIYLKQGVTGIRTVTWYDPETGRFGTLGHGVNDPAGQLVTMVSGNAYRARVVGVIPGRSGKPGQLQGAVTAGQTIGQLQRNTQMGLFGTLAEGFDGQLLEVAEAGEIRTGPALIRSTVAGTVPRDYSVEILKIYPGSTAQGRNLMLKITDPALMETTGGIVQGMSGSPIIQDGKLVGAVTHVLVNDPTRGYGILIENMLDAAG